MPRPVPGEIERRLGDLMGDLDKIARPDVPGRRYEPSTPPFRTLPPLSWPHQAFAMQRKPSVPGSRSYGTP